jgi:hypothetical protein
MNLLMARRLMANPLAARCVAINSDNVVIPDRPRPKGSSNTHTRARLGVVAQYAPSLGTEAHQLRTLTPQAEPLKNVICRFRTVLCRLCAKRIQVFLHRKGLLKRSG